MSQRLLDETQSQATPLEAPDKQVKYFSLQWPPTASGVKELVTALIDGQGFALPDIESLVRLIRRARTILDRRSNVVTLDPSEGPIAVIGDLHGQFPDFLRYMVAADEEDAVMLINGDIVDRDPFSLEILAVLLYRLVVDPRKVMINRGNHESGKCTARYGFQREVRARYGSDLVYEESLSLFQSIPIATIVHGTALVVHGGPWNPATVDLQTIQDLDRHVDCPTTGPMADMLWSDPMPTDGTQPSARAAGVMYGPDVSAGVCRQLGVKGIIRSHQVTPEGLSTVHEGLTTTVFSAPGRLPWNRGGVVMIRQTGDGVEAQPLLFKRTQGPDAARTVQCCVM
ncbi:Calcineurin-like phosphoesterase [Carpediemonas membranifera]|uniref:Serine/threonine-protein phosphatase n=1 Tax=Carpediemonas membranifera TaxID=201153 RepID=A0A8J6E163_9EUKA|nr:Calcineurin-like phosphoesterase [Carpediemonas membranifera]|eukprot:KAG9393068.1 Calcineurin-like phosphoesterase [Carpediemonas membranifera]